jgi:integrase
MVPSERMKEGKEHRVPLSKPAKHLLLGLPRFFGSGFIFPSPNGKHMSDMTISAVMRRIQATEEKAGKKGFRYSIESSRGPSWIALNI